MESDLRLELARAPGNTNVASPSPTSITKSPGRSLRARLIQKLDSEMVVDLLHSAISRVVIRNPDRVKKVSTE